MGLFTTQATNWKYILILIFFTVLAGVVILVFAQKVGQDILAISQRYEMANQ